MGGTSEEKKAMKKYHDIKNLHFSGQYMVLTIDGNEKKFRIKDVSSALERATEQERSSYEVSPSGYPVHWPMIDEDISIDGLLGIVHIRETKRKAA
jgi:hypothetical protein